MFNQSEPGRTNDRRRRSRRPQARPGGAPAPAQGQPQPGSAPNQGQGQGQNQGQGPGQGQGRGRRRRGGGGSTAGLRPQLPQLDPRVGTREARGLLEVTPNGAGVLRDLAIASPDDPLISPADVRQLGLRPGDWVTAMARGRNVIEVTGVNGHGLEGLADRPVFDRLTAIHPETQIMLGQTPEAITGRILDLIAPIGRGQRGLIVSPPKAGKTTILTEIAKGVARNPELSLITCLVAERPEEVTEIRRRVPGLVLAADLDMPASEHIRVADLGIEHGKRLAEQGEHVVLLLDRLTRLARAHNLNIRGGGRTLSGGMEVGALQPVRKAFGAARATEEAGSLTIVATCLLDTGSKMDDVVYEEFKGTGNMEVHLDRKLAQKRLFPAIDINRSGTRREELLLDPATFRQVTAMRRKLAGVPADKALSALLAALARQIPAQDAEVITALGIAEADAETGAAFPR